ncbi:hypothetical protein [Methylobacterium pseudosasicola]|uniref:hypothetical protein n=1 Tax=Methylobacterium pseudosasicola TaxID=582667 RepID=UPI000B88AD22|nr:hypothetical protein [Methylobacterium pseudosasicola]
MRFAVNGRDAATTQTGFASFAGLRGSRATTGVTCASDVTVAPKISAVSVSIQKTILVQALNDLYRTRNVGAPLNSKTDLIMVLVLAMSTSDGVIFLASGYGCRRLPATSSPPRSQSRGWNGRFQETR